MKRQSGSRSEVRLGARGRGMSRPRIGSRMELVGGSLIRTLPFVPVVRTFRPGCVVLIVSVCSPSLSSGRIVRRGTSHPRLCRLLARAARRLAPATWSGHDATAGSAWAERTKATPAYISASMSRPSSEQHRGAKPHCCAECIATVRRTAARVPASLPGCLDGVWVELPTRMAHA